MGAHGFCARRPIAPFVRLDMFRWLLVVFLALLLIQGLTPWLNKLGFGRLPGDMRFRLFGREFFIPLTTTIILSMVCALIARLI